MDFYCVALCFEQVLLKASVNLVTPMDLCGMFQIKERTIPF